MMIKGAFYGFVVDPTGYRNAVEIFSSLSEFCVMLRHKEVLPSYGPRINNPFDLE
jgi:hypothetical protein